jgi:hypothetical protein
VLDRALVYLGATDEQIREHRDQTLWPGSSQVRLLPLRKNLLRINWNKL